MLKNIWSKNIVFCLMLAAMAGLNSTFVLADHQLKKSKEKILKTHDLRTNKIPSLYKIDTVEATNPIEVSNSAKPNAAVRGIMKSTELLSVLYFDGATITTDEANKKYGVSDASKHYSMSISKSFIGYLLGHAICDGHIKSVFDPIETYVLEAKGTVYQGETLRDLSNMVAGDQDFVKKISKGKYTSKVVNLKGTEPIKKLLSDAKGIKMSASKTFSYHGIKTDLIARAVDVAVPGGLGSYLSEKVSKPAGFANSITLLRDPQGWPVGLSWFCLSRGDYLKFGIQVSKDWQSNSCVGKYLRDAYANRNKSQNYGSFFWFEPGQNNMPQVEMRGHGGQRVIVKTSDGSVLSYFSMRAKYSKEDLENLF